MVPVDFNGLFYIHHTAFAQCRRVFSPNTHCFDRGLAFGFRPRKPKTNIVRTGLRPPIFSDTQFYRYQLTVRLPRSRSTFCLSIATPADLFASSRTVERQDDRGRVQATRAHPLEGAPHFASSPSPINPLCQQPSTQGVKRWQSERKMPVNDSAPPVTQCTALSTEQLAQFMSAPTELWPLDGSSGVGLEQQPSTQRSRSRSFGDQIKGSRLTSNLSNEAGIRSSEHVASQSVTSRQSPQSPARPPLNNLTSSLLGASTSSDPSQSSLFQVGDPSTPLKASGKRRLFSLKLFRGSKSHRPKVSRSEDFEHLKLEWTVTIVGGMRMREVGSLASSAPVMGPGDTAFLMDSTKNSTQSQCFCLGVDQPASYVKGVTVERLYVLELLSGTKWSICAFLMEYDHRSNIPVNVYYGLK
ncbi:hypothetical protein CLF_107596 [Clonorchis sinensis]|uniref:Uncharacterized protein n=1 Tax=Clonorchis sinensis TaxID=79923 RepID=H2KRZ1_CLOSI|nr:hypothetical protein CLF_107596 [Clonorchis sinensis]